MMRSRSTTTSHHRILIVALILLIAVLPINTSQASSLYAQIYDDPPVGGAPPPPPPPAPGPGAPAPAPPPGPAPAPGPYPGPGSNVVTGQNFEQALTKASLSTSFDSDRLVENESTRFTATIVYARQLGPGPKIDVAYANDADLNPLDPKQFDVTPVSGARQYLSDGQPDGKGGLTLAWTWDVIPRAVGSLTLTLEIKPVVVVGGVVSTELALRNKPVTIDVVINPNHAKFNEVVGSSDKDFTLSVPNSWKAQEPATITASFVLQDASPDVRLSLALDPADGSVPLTIVEKPPGPNPPPHTVFAEWEVTPGKEGDVRLKAAAIIATQSGDRALEQRIEKPVAKVADPAPSFWGPIQGIIAGLSALIGLVVAAAGLAKIFPSQWKWVRRKLRLPESGPNPPTPPTS